MLIQFVLTWLTVSCQWSYYTPIRFKRDNIFHYFSLMKSSDNIFYFFTCILPDYLAHESLKEFLKNIYFEDMRAGFHLRSQNSPRFVIPEMMHIQPWKKNISTSSWSNLDFDVLKTSKWKSGPQFCERLSCNWQINDQKWSKNGHLCIINFHDFFFQNWKK